jgi:predicted  nucleic acid-binding Zn-ribbon protein
MELFEHDRSTREQLLAMEQRLNRKLEIIMSDISQQQAAINADTTAVQNLVSAVQAQSAQLETDVAAIRTAVAALPQNVDTSALDSAVASIASTQQGLVQSVSDVTAASQTQTAPVATPPAPTA